MKFGPTPLDEALGATLAHSLSVSGRKLKKGARLGQEDIAALRAAGLAEVVAARLDPSDMPEDAAAAALGAALAPTPTALGLSLSASFTGRLNVYALTGGVLRVDAALVHAVNALDEAVTLATLPDCARVNARQMLATVKIIPYAAPRSVVEEACGLLSAGRALRLHPPRMRSATLILTRTAGMKEKLLDKGSDAVRVRLAALGVHDVREVRTDHEAVALTDAVREADGDIVLILGGASPSDRRDVAPAALEAAGGTVRRFGLPVDPGNLVFLGDAVDGARSSECRGTARSPALSGIDWVLERIVCGVPVSAQDIASMGVGGLLKEIPSRPQPRGGGAHSPARPVVSAVLLAAGASSRMGGRDKLLECIDGEPLLRRAARALLASRADETLAVLRPEDDARRAALEGLDVKIVENPGAAEGMASSIRAGLAAIRTDADAMALAFGDMPEVSALHLDALISTFDPGEGRAICRAADEEGRPGHPVLFGRRFFENLSRLAGDDGARDIVRANAEFVVDVRTPGRAARIDLDTPEAWTAWRNGSLNGEEE